MDPALIAIIDRHGVFLRGEALMLGYSERQITGLTAHGTFVRVRHGAYTYAERWRGLDECGQHLVRAQAAFRTADAEVAVSHASAVTAHRVPSWGLDLSQVHLLRLDGKSGRRSAGVTQHRGEVFPDDLDHRDDLVVTSPTRTVLDVIATCDVERSLIVANSMLHAGKTTKRLLENRAVEMLTRPHFKRSHLVLSYCNPSIESVGETRTWLVFKRLGLPEPEVQYKVYEEGGRLVARLDFAWPDFGVFVEFDGRIKYERLLRPGESASDVVIREKQRERVVTELTGWVCVRITWADLADPQALLTRLHSAFRLARQLRAARLTRA